MLCSYKNSLPCWAASAVLSQDVHKRCPPLWHTHTATHGHKHANTHTHTHSYNTWATRAWATTDSLVRSRGEAFCEEGEGVDQIHIYESYIHPKHIAVIYNRYRLAASKTLNINVKWIYDKRNKLHPRKCEQLFFTRKRLSTSLYLIIAITFLKS